MLCWLLCCKISLLASRHSSPCLTPTSPRAVVATATFCAAFSSSVTPLVACCSRGHRREPPSPLTLYSYTTTPTTAVRHSRRHRRHCCQICRRCRYCRRHCRHLGSINITNAYYKASYAPAIARSYISDLLRCIFLTSFFHIFDRNHPSCVPLVTVPSVPRPHRLSPLHWCPFCPEHCKFACAFLLYFLSRLTLLLSLSLSPSLGKEKNREVCTQCIRTKKKYLPIVKCANNLVYLPRNPHVMNHHVRSLENFLLYPELVEHREFK